MKMAYLTGVRARTVEDEHNITFLCTTVHVSQCSDVRAVKYLNTNVCRCLCHRIDTVVSANSIVAAVIIT